MKHIINKLSLKTKRDPITLDLSDPKDLKLMVNNFVTNNIDMDPVDVVMLFVCKAYNKNTYDNQSLNDMFKIIRHEMIEVITKRINEQSFNLEDRIIDFLSKHKEEHEATDWVLQFNFDIALAMFKKSPVIYDIFFKNVIPQPDVMIAHNIIPPPADETKESDLELSDSELPNFSDILGEL